MPAFAPARERLLCLRLGGLAGLEIGGQPGQLPPRLAPTFGGFGAGDGGREEGLEGRALRRAEGRGEGKGGRVQRLRLAGAMGFGLAERRLPGQRLVAEAEPVSQGGDVGIAEAEGPSRLGKGGADPGLPGARRLTGRVRLGQRAEKPRLLGFGSGRAAGLGQRLGEEGGDAVVSRSACSNSVALAASRARRWLAQAASRRLRAAAASARVRPVAEAAPRSAAASWRSRSRSARIASAVLWASATR